ncbi:hypothetical protein FPRO05_02815 [Fusarium proliferatum]|uniref:Extracellular membrane protein CFEM domain-containing protein n=1 Tax=Gibberella intermedia TaxID=948311 RepID=A0A365MZQ4_GIBIN|nr:hypothetical protein FPRO05_02815 [Fusarium proliferatum]
MYTSTIALAIAPLLYLARADISLDRDDIPRECDTICDPIVQLTKTCDTDLRGDRDREEDRLEAQCLTTTIVGGTRTQNSNEPSATGSSGGNGGSGSNDNNNDASATNDASNPDETNAAAAMAPYGVVGAVVGAAMLLA